MFCTWYYLEVAWFNCYITAWYSHNVVSLDIYITVQRASEMGSTMEKSAKEIKYKMEKTNYITWICVCERDSSHSKCV